MFTVVKHRPFLTLCFWCGPGALWICRRRCALGPLERLVTLRIGPAAGSLSLTSAKNAAPGNARRLFFRLRSALAPLRAYPPRFLVHTAHVGSGRSSGSGLSFLSAAPRDL